MHTDNESNRLITDLLNHLESIHQKNSDIQRESLHLISHAISTLKNKSKSSIGVPLSSTNSPWPTSVFPEPCLICKYYGHSFKGCVNIVKERKGSCLRCFKFGH